MRNATAFLVAFNGAICGRPHSSRYQWLDGLSLSHTRPPPRRGRGRKTGGELLWARGVSVWGFSLTVSCFDLVCCPLVSPTRTVQTTHCRLVAKIVQSEFRLDLLCHAVLVPRKQWCRNVRQCRYAWNEIKDLTMRSWKLLFVCSAKQALYPACFSTSFCF